MGFVTIPANPFLDGRQQPLTVYGPTSTAILDILETDGIDARLPEGTASAELLNQYRAWFGLGGTSSNLGYEVRWLLGDKIQPLG